jgi:hypothetical protein
MLFLEADACKACEWSEGKYLGSERDVVKESAGCAWKNPLRKRARKDPCRRLSAGIVRALVIGCADLDAAGLADVRAYPLSIQAGNAKLVWSAISRTDEATRKIRKYFGAIPKSGDKSVHAIPVPAITQSARAAMYF